jgi:glutaredoxin
MSNYYLKVIILEGCPYGNKTKKLLNENNIQTKYVYIDHENKENYKTEDIQTFPQIYLNKYNSKGNLLLGGSSDLEDFISTFKNKQYNVKNVNNFMEKYKWSKKAVLRLIQLIN